MSSIADNEQDLAILRAWQTQNLPELEASHFTMSSIFEKISALTYYFRPISNTTDHVAFQWTRFAILKTWKECGLIRTIIVTNAVTDAQKKLQSEYPGLVDIQVEPSLTPGDINSMTLDCHTKLWKRFKTKFVMIIQDDGFPLRPGLERFVGRYDYIGAPWRRNVLAARIYGIFHRQWPMNGGFCIRSKRFCELVSKYWNTYYAMKPFDFDKHSDDTFCTVTLPKEHRWFRYQVHAAESGIASDFSYDAYLQSNMKKHVFGIHGAKAFCELMAAGII